MSANNTHDPNIVELLNRLIESTVDHAVFLLYPDTKIRWCNAAAMRMFALTPDVIGHPFAELFTPEDRKVGIPGLEVAIAESSLASVDDRWHLRADGTKFWASGVLTKIVHPETSELLGYGKLIRDRTDWKTQLDLVGNQRAALETENQTKDRAITNLAHELRNVIAGIRGSLELLNRPLDDEGLRARFFPLMQGQIGMVERLVEDLLDVKRVERGGVILKLEPLVLQHELRTCIDRFERRLHAEDIILEFLAPSAEVMVNADRVRLQQIYGNLLENAIKFTSAGGKVWIKLTTEDDLAVVHVEDNGRGIPHEMLEDIFNLFTQVDTTISGGGLGVGLALVRELTLLHDGSVQASSQGLGTGSEFSVRLPLLRTTTAQ